MVVRYKQQLGAAIKARRRELGLTQKQIAEAAHVKEPQTVSRWERGETAPSDLEAVAQALKTTIAELMAGIQPPARVAHKLELSSEEEPAEARLERIEAMLAKIYALLSPAAEVAAEAVADVLSLDARLEDADESRTPPARAPRKSQSRGKRHKSA